MPDDSDMDKLRRECWDSALHAFATAYMFEHRARGFRRLITLLRFLGLALPLSIGALVLHLGTKWPYLQMTMGIVVTFGILQLVATLWAVVRGWDVSYAYALESLTSNHNIARQFESLGKQPPSDEIEFRTRLELVRTEDRLRSDSDYKQGLSEKEKRRGMRAALRNYQRPCAECKKAPASMQPTDCPVCGNF